MAGEEVLEVEVGFEVSPIYELTNCQSGGMEQCERLRNGEWHQLTVLVDDGLV